MNATSESALFDDVTLWARSCPYLCVTNQRIRDKLRKEMEVAEQRVIRPEDLRQDLPARVVELLAHPRLTDLPENPVGKTLETLRTEYADFTEQGLPEVVDLKPRA